jgi:hypothetical protein
MPKIAPHHRNKSVFEIIDANRDRKLNKPELMAYLETNRVDNSGYVRSGICSEGASRDYNVLARKSGIFSINDNLVTDLGSKNALQSEDREKSARILRKLTRIKNLTQSNTKVAQTGMQA